MENRLAMSRSCRIRILAMMCLLPLGTGFLWAKPCCLGEKDPVKVTLIVILASEEGNRIDKQLKAIAAEIQKQNPNLKSFKIKSMETKALKPGERVSLPAVEDAKVKMVILHGADKENRVSLAVTAPRMKEIEYESACGKFLPIVTPYQTKNKERLILAIRVQPCRGE